MHLLVEAVVPVEGRWRVPEIDGRFGRAFFAALSREI